VGEDIRVLYKDTEYYPYRYELGFDSSGKSIHTAILIDLNKHSLLYCGLVEIKEEQK
jgi:hypothetical protein